MNAIQQSIVRPVSGTMLRFLEDLRRGSVLLTQVGWIFWGLTVLFVALIPLDSRTILGVNPWIKPLKFSVSIAIFTWTVARLLVYLEAGRGRRHMEVGIAAAMFFEIACIAGQSARGVKSHFNNGTVVDGIVFSLMGLAIMYNTVLLGMLTYRFFRSGRVTEALRSNPVLWWGIRLGLVVFMLGSLQGGYLASQPGHSVGSGDGGPGLPMLNWSTIAGDLRIAHFLGLHALQAIPLFAWLVSQWTARGVLLTFGFAGAYTLAFSLSFVQAVLGIPLFG